MRAPFDRLIDLFYGPNTATPGDLKHHNVLCRVVPDLAFREQEAPLSKSVSYITCEDVLPAGPGVTQTSDYVYNYDFGKADAVSLTPGTDPLFTVVRVELRTWNTGVGYWRAHIAPTLDVLPSVCSGEYGERYRMNNGIGLIVDMDRIGPTTWVYGPYTLTAEFYGPPVIECGSYWRFTDGIHNWDGYTDGVGGWTAFSFDGGSPLAVTMSHI